MEQSTKAKFEEVKANLVADLEAVLAKIKSTEIKAETQWMDLSEMSRDASEVSSFLDRKLQRGEWQR